MSRFSDSLSFTGGIQVETWFKNHFTTKDAKDGGKEIPGIGPFNSTLLVIHNRRDLNTQYSSLYDQGTPTPTGKIYGFEKAEDEFTRIFRGEYSKDHRLSRVFCLPLIASVEDCSDLWVWISDCSANFVSGRMGNNTHSATHIATAYLSTLSIICYQLAESLAPAIGVQEETRHSEILTTELKSIEASLVTPDLLTGDAERHMLCDALEWITHSLRVLTEYSPDIWAILQTMSLAYNTPDTLQSLNATYILNREAEEGMVGHWIYLSYRRYFLRSMDSSFITNFPVGLTALMVVAPHILDPVLLFLRDDDEKKGNWAENVEDLINALDQTLRDVSMKFESGEIVTEYDLRLNMLESFNKVSMLVEDTTIRKICEAVENDRSFDSVIRPVRPDWTIEATSMINGRSSQNKPHFMTSKDCPDDSSVRVIGSDSSNWSAICLRPGIKLRVKINTLGCRARIGNTRGGARVQNVRFGSTFDPHRMDIMRGQKGVSVSGQVYHPLMDRFKPHIQPQKINQDGVWIVTCDSDGLVVTCNDQIVLADCDPYIPVDESGEPLTPRYANSDRYGMIAFKNCYLDLECMSCDK